MAVPSFSDLVLKLASDEPIISNPNGSGLWEGLGLGSGSGLLSSTSANLVNPADFGGLGSGHLRNFGNGVPSEVGMKTPVPVSQLQEGLSLGSGSGLLSSTSANLVNTTDFGGIGSGDLRNFGNGVPSEVGMKTPVPVSQLQLAQPGQSSAESSLSRKRKRGDNSDLEVILDPKLNPEWLPVDWKVVSRTRPNGKSAGSKDTYYREPVKNRQFRSKREVLEYLANGPKGKSPKKLKNKEDTANVMHLKSSQPLKFNAGNLPEKVRWNSVNPPEKVKWHCGNSEEKLWTPFIGEERVPEHAKLEWQAMFNPLFYQSGGYRS